MISAATPNLPLMNPPPNDHHREGGHWGWTSAHTLDRGLYLLRRWGNDVGTISLLPDITHHAVRLEAICAALDAVDERLERARLQHPSGG